MRPVIRTTIVALLTVPVVGAGTNIVPAFTTWKHVREEGKSSVCFTKTNGSIHACMYETHGSCMFPYAKRRKQSSADCCWHSKVFTMRIHSPFPCHTYCTRKTLPAQRVYTQTVIGVFFIHGNGNTHVCLTR